MKAEWLIVTPDTSTGNGTVAFSTNPYKGRNERTTQVSIEAEGVEPEIVNVTQQGAEEFVTIQETANLSGEGGELVLKGKSNSTKLTFSLGAGEIEISIPETYLVGEDKTVNNGEVIDGDPGASDEYEYSLTLTLPVNVTGAEKTREVKVTDNAAHEATCTITQSSSEATLSVSTNEVTLNSNGDAVEIEVYSNTTWTIK